MERESKNRRRLLRMIQGESVEEQTRYFINYSVDIRGNITIWSGFSFESDEVDSPFIEKGKEKVLRNQVPIYDYYRLSPYTARIFQIEQELDISDEALISAYERFREERPSEGFGAHYLFSGLVSSDEKIQIDRTDKESVREGLLIQERKDILNLFGVDCPPDINDNEHYGERLDRNQGQVSDWYKQEFSRIGGDFDKLWSHS